MKILKNHKLRNAFLVLQKIYYFGPLDLILTETSRDINN